MKCSVDDCDKDAKTRGWCIAHYSRVLRHGDTTYRSGAPRGSAMKFIDDHLTYVSDDCLIWPYSRQKQGYGEIYSQISKLAHRVMCVLAHGAPPTSKHEAAHSCGKGHNGCVNPGHLSWKTPVENARDKQSHGTQPFGAQVWHLATLTREQAVEAKYGAEGLTFYASKFGVHRNTIRRIRNNTTWRGI